MIITSATFVARTVVESDPSGMTARVATSRPSSRSALPSSGPLRLLSSAPGWSHRERGNGTAPAGMGYLSCCTPHVVSGAGLAARGRAVQGDTRGLELRLRLLELLHHPLAVVLQRARLWPVVPAYDGLQPAAVALQQRQHRL